VNTKPPATPVLMIVAGLWMMYVAGYATVLPRLLTDVNGVVTSSVDNPYRGAARYVSEYTILQKNHTVTYYIAGPSDSSLARGLPVGTTILKKKWALNYKINGHDARPFSEGVYLTVLLAGIVSFLAGAYRWPAWRRAYMAA
jgi:hypothetical protein